MNFASTYVSSDAPIPLQIANKPSEKQMANPPSNTQITFLICLLTPPHKHALPLQFGREFHPLT